MPGDHIMAKDHMLVNFVTRHLDMKSVSVNIGKTAFMYVQGILAIHGFIIHGFTIHVFLEGFKSLHLLYIVETGKEKSVHMTWLILSFFLMKLLRKKVIDF